MFTGCKLNEACQLRLDDIRKKDGVWVINFNESREDQSLKGSFPRNVLLHKTLITADFSGFVERLREAGYDRLFSQLIFMDTGNRYSRRVGRHLRDLGSSTQHSGNVLGRDGLPGIRRWQFLRWRWFVDLAFVWRDQSDHGGNDFISISVADQTWTPGLRHPGADTAGLDHVIPGWTRDAGPVFQ